MIYEDIINAVYVGFGLFSATTAAILVVKELISSQSSDSNTIPLVSISFNISWCNLTFFCLSILLACCKLFNRSSFWTSVKNR